MISGMPKHAQGPIKNYLETGNFEDHEKFPMPNDEETLETKANFEANIDAFVKSDQGPEDSNDTPGQITTQDKFFGEVTGAFKKSEDGKTLESFMVIGGEDGAVMYNRSTPDGLDMITVGSKDGGDGVMHFSNTDPNGHFMSFAGD